ncbi:MAG: signal peptidase I [Candidatus Pacebacteria bacterium]|nr:signal peptidase I [Candidatus Paceibacterota bacterium]MCF7857608.1 signal peptidase I [Candidatus Paceibacterota bacterium]
MDLSPESQNPLQTNTDKVSPAESSQKNEKESMFGEIVRFSLIALLIVLPVRLFIAQPFIVSGASMETTFSTGQYIIVDQLTYHFEEPVRGEVIVFRYPKDPSKFFIKRIIAIPGDTIAISGRDVIISNDEHPDGVHLDESYVHDMKPTTTLTETLGNDEYFVMGDNRDASSDSRSWGVLQRDKIIGRAFLRLFPFTNIGIFPGSFVNEAGGEL